MKQAVAGLNVFAVDEVMRALDPDLIDEGSVGGSQVRQNKAAWAGAELEVSPGDAVARNAELNAGVPTQDQAACLRELEHEALAGLGAVNDLQPGAWGRRGRRPRSRELAALRAVQGGWLFQSRNRLSHGQVRGLLGAGLRHLDRLFAARAVSRAPGVFRADGEGVTAAAGERDHGLES